MCDAQLRLHSYQMQSSTKGSSHPARGRLVGKITLVCFLAFAAIVNPVYNQDITKVGTSSAAFLGIDIGARAAAVGGAYVAISDDLSAIYWNPAGLSRIKTWQVAFMHAELIADTKFDWGAMLIPLNRFGSMALSVTSLSHEDMEIRTIAEPEGTEEFFSAGDLLLALSYAISLSDRFSIGFNGKFIHSQIYNESANAIGFDVGTLFNTGYRGLKIGATIINFGQKMKLSGRDLIILVDPAPAKFGSNDRIVSELQTGSFDLPLAFRAGIAMDVLTVGSSRLTVSIEAFNPSDNAESVNAGFELSFSEYAAIRFGYKSLFKAESEEGFAGGGGLALKLRNGPKIVLDYAYSDFGRLKNVTRFSVAVEF